MSSLGSLGNRLSRGEVAFGLVSRRRLWFSISAVVLLVTALTLGLRGLDFGVEFTGGTVVTFQTEGATQSEVEQATRSVVGASQVTVREVSGGRWRVETERLDSQQVSMLQSALGQRFGLPPNAISPQVVGPSWGEQISQRALLSLAVFLALVVAYLTVAFEWKMALAAIVGLLHDLALTAGVYAVVGFEVTPATVIGMLTILGYSLYDTVVVFDKVRENTAGLLGGSRMTYSQAANRAVNQVLMRSINTSVTTLLPVGSILFIGAGLLGAGILKDLALVLFVGIAVGTYSSIFLATPLLAELKEREPQMRSLARRVAARQGGGESGGRAAAASQTNAAGAGDVEQAPHTGEPPRTGEEGAAEGGPTPAGVGAESPGTSPNPSGQSGQPGPPEAETPGRAVQEGRRQQPRRGGSKRRPSGKKK